MFAEFIMLRCVALCCVLLSYIVPFVRNKALYKMTTAVDHLSIVSEYLCAYHTGSCLHVVSPGVVLIKYITSFLGGI